MRDGRLYLAVPPAGSPVTVADAKAWCQIDGDDHDALLARMISAATGNIDGRDGWLGRALVTQTWELRLDCFPRSIRIPLPPLQSIASITYVDGNGVIQTLDPAAYQVKGVGGLGPATVVPAYGTSWPTVRDDAEVVTVRFICGYPSTGGSPEDVGDGIPHAIRQALLIMVADAFEQRETFQIGSVASKVPVTADAEGYLAPYKVHFFA